MKELYDAEHPWVSVIIPTYNMASLVGRAIESVLQNTFQEVEVIVVDDGSTDETESIVDNFIDPSGNRFDPRVHYVYQPNRGKAAALNTGIRTAEGFFFTILDADDELPAKSLAYRYAEVQKASGRVDCLIGGFNVIDEDGKLLGYRPAPKTTDSDKLRRHYFFHYQTPFHLCACLFHRNLAERVGEFNSEITRVDDLDYALRILREAACIRTVDFPVYHYRKYRTSIRDRLRIRWSTMKQRPIVYWTHAAQPYAPFAVAMGLATDVGKCVYEVICGNYEQ